MTKNKEQTHYYTYKGKDYNNMKNVCVANNLTPRAFRFKVKEDEITKTVIISQNRQYEGRRTQ